MWFGGWSGRHLPGLDGRSLWGAEDQVGRTWSQEVSMMEGVLGAWGRPRSCCGQLVLEVMSQRNMILSVVWDVVRCGHQQFDKVGRSSPRQDTPASGEGMGRLSWQGCGRRWWWLAEGCFP